MMSDSGKTQISDRRKITSSSREWMRPYSARKQWAREGPGDGEEKPVLMRHRRKQRVKGDCWRGYERKIVIALAHWLQSTSPGSMRGTPNVRTKTRSRRGGRQP